MMRRIVAALAVIACSRAPVRDARWQQRAEAMSGMWSVRLSFGSTPAQATGTMTLTANHAIDHAVDGIGLPTNYGAYAIDFRALGFSPSGVQVPAVFVGACAGDSIGFVFETDRPAFSMSMRGSLHADTVTGRWSAEESRSTLARGSFIMTHQ
jgi:hypothetical protein